ncbi:hypothetical protein [Microbacterium panaciterrae]|uniref:Uncharacterized protein n=1 Tax=Microbacterium panaciterrae TaxID=985759 RepID=A0ABP8P855_9MICO
MTMADGESGRTPSAEMGERPGVVQVAMRWWLAQLLLTVYGGYQTWMSPFNGDSCGVGGGSCNFDALEQAAFNLPFVPR